MSLFWNLSHGLLAGATGTAALNALTYADMAKRGRPASELPIKMAATFASMLDLSEFSKPAAERSEKDTNRLTGLGALLGYANGFGVGAFLGMVRPSIRQLPCFWVGLLLAGVTLAASEGTASALGQTDPREWSASDWLEISCRAASMDGQRA